ncbi:S8 family serine peptidase [Bdellovibrio svalbardensis]|uniref:S8 family serine peptidase n=1 Tax=Bdellovibrio svalbardensis TaxID=2972972 RepID=A0ABT6DGF4_9BACT|nr:S8 family serine peptidase [Bdellovibrio svalbardensis]MDG0815925.1 S8 family serine peptidase [Bdellovibrio svalbardensis]
MKRTILLSALLFGSQAFAGEFLVKYTNTNGLNFINNLGVEKSIGMQVMDHNPTASLVKVDIAKSKEAQTLAELLATPGIEYVVPNFKLKAFSAPVNAAALRDQWAINKVQAEKAWKRAGNRGNKNVIVAVIDTGVDYKHESLAPNMLQGYNFKDKNNDPMDKTSFQNPGHGTHCAGVVGATGLIDGGTIGMAPGISIMPLRFLDEKGSGDLNDGIKAIDYAIEKGVHVISASWGASVPRSTAQPLLEAIKRADDKGIIFVSAAANDGKNNDSTEVYPANNGYPNSITVAASGPSDAKPSWSNYGTAMVHLASPGEGIVSTLPKNKYGDLSGTSMATPLVAGLVAFLKSQDSSLTGSQIRAILQTTGAKVSIQTACNCRIDAFNAVDAVLSKKMFVVPAAGTLSPQGTLNLSVLNGKAPFKYASSNSSTATVSDAGVVTAVGNGKTSITVTDADGKTASTLDINVGKSQSPPGNDPGNPGQPGQPPGDGSCPIGDASLCQIICQIKPDLPFCKQ